MNENTKRILEREDILSLMYHSSEKTKILAMFERDIVVRKYTDGDIFARFSYFAFGNVGIHTSNKILSEMKLICEGAVGTNREIHYLCSAELFNYAYRNYRADMDEKKKPIVKNLDVRGMIGELYAHLVAGGGEDREYKLFALLALVTGRRITELLKTLKILEGFEDGSLKYSGILKKRGGSDVVIGYPIGNIPVEILQKFLLELQGRYVSVSDKKISALSGRFGMGLHRVTGGQISTPHDCRHLYLSECLDSGQWAREEGEGDEQHRRRLLGHNIPSDTTRGYISKILNKKHNEIDEDEDEEVVEEKSTKKFFKGLFL